MQLGDEFVWAMVSHDYSNGKSVHQSYSIGEKKNKKNAMWKNKVPTAYFAVLAF